MDLLNISSKTFVKIISICLLIATLTGTTYYFTKGGFFDGILLTCVGLSCTYLILILSLLIFKSLTNILAKNTIKVWMVILSFVATVSICGYLFLFLFNSIAGEFKV
ncbi:hypothetical protein [Olleya aquimaris]|uniref:Uncharacterized protein n=1 Tax=Olleya aquimaris TaxID=639310 RepID=A0A327RR16_9FLAO|nr:hypothetical protein [Olleya aquimaris]RAJ18043.1 hypothetical protein LY08_00316 [Olleya aquimaris]